LRSIAASPESDELAKKVGKIELDRLAKEVPPEERKKHAELIRNLLVRINQDYKKRYGSPPPTVRTKVEEMASIPRDVEMAAA